MAKAKQNADNQTGQLDPATAYQRIANVLALLLVKDLKNQSEQIALLSRAGFKSREIAEMLGTTGNTVSVAISQQKRPKKKTK